jgi:hypothetical protein
MPAEANAASGPATFRCEAEPAHVPTPPPLPADAVFERSAAPAPVNVCPTGQLPYPVPVAGPKQVPPPQFTHLDLNGSGAAGRSSRRGATRSLRVRTAMQSIGGAWDGYVIHDQPVPASTGFAQFFSDQTQQDPALDTADSAAGHSLSQLWVVNYNNSSTVEFGWIVSPGLYTDSLPHMFVDHADGGSYGPYNGGFVPYPGAPLLTAALPYGDGSLHTYGIIYSSEEWWFYHDGYFLGYIPVTAWTHRVGTPTDLQNGGEVESTASFHSCSQMGSGTLGSASSGYARWANTYYIDRAGYDHNARANNWGSTPTDPSAWNRGHVSIPDGGQAAFGYGGPGYSGC